MGLRRMWKNAMLKRYSTVMAEKLSRTHLPVFFPNSANAEKTPLLAFSGANAVAMILRNQGHEPHILKARTSHLFVVHCSVKRQA